MSPDNRRRTTAFVIASFLAAIGVAVAPPAPARAGTSDRDTGSNTSAPSEPVCVHSDPHKLLGRGIPQLDKLDYLSFVRNKESMWWLFASSDNPKSGSVFVLSCNGHSVAKRSLGHAKQVDFGAWVSNFEETADVRYVSASRSGLYKETTALLGFDGKSIRVLWEHDVKVVVSPTPSAGGGVNATPLKTETDNFDWKFGYPSRDDERASEIHVTGTASVELDGNTSKRALPPETYCYRAQLSRFVRC